MLDCGANREASMLKTAAAFVFALTALFATAVPGGAQSRWQEVTASDGSFSFSMPARPKEESRTGTHYHYPSQSLIYVSSVPGLQFIFAGRTHYHRDAKLSTQDELQANASNFAKSINGNLISQRFFTWSGDGSASYEAHESTVDSAKGTFRQLYVMDGKTVYGVIAGPKSGENEVDIDRFFASLRLGKR